MAKYGTCEVCGINGIVTEHHKIKRSQQPALIKCKMNLIDLCEKCHYSIHHGKEGHDLDETIKLQFQNYLEIVFNKDYFSREEVQAILDINSKSTDRLLKTLKQYNGLFAREDIVRISMGGKLIILEEYKNE